MRFLNRLYACIFGYFWLECPICLKYFGGHECADTGIMISWYSGLSVCKRCAEEANRRNQEWMENNPHPPIIIQK